jgi:hypothetical protein
MAGDVSEAGLAEDGGSFLARSFDELHPDLDLFGLRGEKLLGASQS